MKMKTLRYSLILFASVSVYATDNALIKYINGGRFTIGGTNNFAHTNLYAYGKSPYSITYVTDYPSGKNFCWLKELSENRSSVVRFNIDFSNDKYVPETYEWNLNKICKESKKDRAQSIQKIIEKNIDMALGFIGVTDYVLLVDSTRYQLYSRRDSTSLMQNKFILATDHSLAKFENDTISVYHSINNLTFRYSIIDLRDKNTGDLHFHTAKKLYNLITYGFEYKPIK